MVKSEIMIHNLKPYPNTKIPACFGWERCRSTGKIRTYPKSVITSMKNTKLLSTPACSLCEQISGGHWQKNRRGSDNIVIVTFAMKYIEATQRA